MLGKWLRTAPTLALTSAALVLWTGSGTASAARVMVFEHNGRTRVASNRFLPAEPAGAALPGVAPSGPLLAPASSDPLDSSTRAMAGTTASPLATAARSMNARGRLGGFGLRDHARPRVAGLGVRSTFPSALLALARTGQIPGATFGSDLRIWDRAATECRQLGGWRSTQLGDVTALLQELAARGQVTAGRLPALIVMLNRNAQYWRSGAPLAYPDRVQFAGSELVWQYYPGYGLQFQVLGTFGEGDGYYEAGAADYPKLVRLIGEVGKLAVKRAGGIAWEYYFNWEGGQPPWVSAMAQATGIEALTDAYLATGNHAYLQEAHDALPLFERRPPAGTAVAAADGTEFLQYSFAPGTDIINAYLQTLLGLYDYEQASLDPTALALYNAGNAQAERELPAFVIGGWSLYQPGVPDNLNYHELVTEFLQLLCQKTQIPVYCTTYRTFSSDLTTKPSLAQLTIAAVSGKSFPLRFALSKYAAVGVTLSEGTRNYLYTKRDFYAGGGSFRTPALKPGTYELTMSATDPAGNYTRIAGQVQVCSSACPPYTVSAPPATASTTATSTTPTATSTTPTTATSTSTTTTPGTTAPTSTTPTTTTTTSSTTTTPTTTSTTVTATTPTTTNPGGGGTSGL